MAGWFLELLFDLGEIFRGEIPIHQMVKEGFDEFGTLVAIVYVIGMFPDIYAQQGLVTGSQWRAGRSHVDYIQAAISLLYQPCPAGTEVADSGRLKRLLELIEAAPFLVDRVGQCAGWSTAAVWFHAMPIKCVIKNLGRVVKNSGLV